MTRCREYEKERGRNDRKAERESERPRHEYTRSKADRSAPPHTRDASYGPPQGRAESDLFIANDEKSNLSPGYRSVRSEINARIARGDGAPRLVVSPIRR